MEYDKIDLDNNFIIVHKSNLEKYFEKYNCKTEEELSTCLWLNFGVTITII